jgi:hypothetical protein
VVHDELDIDLGRLKLKRGGGEGGHNGLRSVSQSLGTKDYVRVRCGIGRPPGRQDPADFVLTGFAKREQAEVDLLVVDAADAVESIVTEGWRPPSCGCTPAAEPDGRCTVSTRDGVPAPPGVPSPTVAPRPPEAP